MADQASGHQVGEARAQGGDACVELPVEPQTQCGGHQHGGDVRGDGHAQPFPLGQDQEGGQSDAQAPEAGAVQVARQFQRLQKGQVAGVGVLQAQEALGLQKRDDQSDAGGEAHHDGIGDEVDEPPGLEHAHQDLQDTGQHAGGEQPREPELVDHRQQDHHEGGSGTGDVEARSAHQRRDQGADDHGVEPVLRRDSRGHRQGQRQRERDDPDRQSRAEVLAKGVPSVAAHRFAQGWGETTGHGTCSLVDEGGWRQA